MKKSTQRKIVRTIKRSNKALLICSILFLIIGAGLGYYSVTTFTQNDTFEIIGEQTITLNIGDTYSDQGAKAIEFNKDISSMIVTEGIDDVDTSKRGVYTITYTLNSTRYKMIKHYRYIIVNTESGDNNE